MTLHYESLLLKLQIFNLCQIYSTIYIQIDNAICFYFRIFYLALYFYLYFVLSSIPSCQEYESRRTYRYLIRSIKYMYALNMQIIVKLIPQDSFGLLWVFFCVFVFHKKIFFPVNICSSVSLLLPILSQDNLLRHF